MTRALSLLCQRPANIIETGSSAWGTNSSLLFDSYVNSFGGSFASVDIRRQPSRALRKICTPRSKFWCNDSVRFLKLFTQTCSRVDLVYLDSWDVDWSQPISSAIHGFNEYLILLPLLKQYGGLLLVDDTPSIEFVGSMLPHLYDSCKQFESEYGFLPGKGSLILSHCQLTGFGNVIEHQYQALIQF